MNPRNSTRASSVTRTSTARDSSERPRRVKAPKSRPRASRQAVEPSAQRLKSGDERDDNLVPSIGDNLRKLRTERSLSLDAVAEMSGVSRAMLGQIELKRSVPTITVLWRIAKALDVPFSSLMREPPKKGPSVLRRNTAKFLTSADGTFKSRALFPADSQRFVEFYEVRLAPGAVEEATAHPSGTCENIVVAKGSLEVTAGEAPTALAAGDAMTFRADVPHSYHNPGSTEAVIYMVITYVQHG